MAKSAEPVPAIGWAARETSGVLSPFKFTRRHELVGVVTAVGGKVEKFKVGDKVGVGIMIGSCHSCDFCNHHLENYCAELKEIFNDTYYDGTRTYGGF